MHRGLKRTEVDPGGWGSNFLLDGTGWLSLLSTRSGTRTQIQKENGVTLAMGATRLDILVYKALEEI